MRYKLAAEFSRLLVNQIGDENWQRVIELNESEANPAICHSHDYCDANQVMLDACESLGISVDNPLADEFVAITDAAWSIAKSNDFDVNDIIQESAL